MDLKVSAKPTAILQEQSTSSEVSIGRLRANKNNFQNLMSTAIAIRRGFTEDGREAPLRVTR